MGLVGSFFVGRVGSGDPTCPTVCFVKIGHVGTLYVGRVGSGVLPHPPTTQEIILGLPIYSRKYKIAYISKHSYSFQFRPFNMVSKAISKIEPTFDAFSRKSNSKQPIFIERQQNFYSYQINLNSIPEVQIKVITESPGLESRVLA